MERREFTSAVNLFKRVLETDPRHVQSWGNLGLAYASMGERGKALECLDRALELDPEYEVAAGNRVAIERLREGERLGGEIDSVNYYRDYKAKGKKSYIAETIRNIFGKRGLEE
ncbi:MAG: tetratricopeptide repeat protein [Syntrophaceae bacterium]|nr:tetratricopeptide repeat protein [Syntrophaceae bacterium]